jgi:hypothetical protein
MIVALRSFGGITIPLEEQRPEDSRAYSPTTVVHATEGGATFAVEPAVKGHLRREAAKCGPLGMSVLCRSSVSALSDICIQAVECNQLGKSLARVPLGGQWRPLVSP